MSGSVSWLYHPCSGLMLNFNYCEWPGGKTSFSSWHSDDTLFVPSFLSRSYCPSVLPVFLVDVNQNPLPVSLWEVTVARDEQIVSQKREHTLNACLQPFSEYWLLQSAHQSLRGTGNCPESADILLIQSEVISLFSSFLLICFGGSVSGPKGEMALRTGLFLNDKLLLRCDSWWLKSVCESSREYSWAAAHKDSVDRMCYSILKVSQVSSSQGFQSTL